MRVLRDAEVSNSKVAYFVSIAALLIAGSTLTTSASAELRHTGSDTLEPVIESAQIAYARGHAGYKVQKQATGTSSGLRELCTGRAALVGA